MSPRRKPPVTTLQALVGTVLIVVAVAAVVGASHLLQLPRLTTAPLPPPQLGNTGTGSPGEVVCPSRGELRRRPSPMPVKSAELIECPALFDGEQVVYRGEAVGAVLLRSEHAWVHLNDDVYASLLGPLSRHRTVSGGNSGMAVSVARDVGAEVTAGNNRVRGTIVEVVGVFSSDHFRDAGAPGIDASEARVLEEAERFTHAVALPRVVAAGVLAPMALTLTALLVRRRRRAS